MGVHSLLSPSQHPTQFPGYQPSSPYWCSSRRTLGGQYSPFSSRRENKENPRVSPPIYKAGFQPPHQGGGNARCAASSRSGNVLLGHRDLPTPPLPAVAPRPANALGAACILPKRKVQNSTQLNRRGETAANKDIKFTDRTGGSGVGQRLDCGRTLRAYLGGRMLFNFSAALLL